MNRAKETPSGLHAFLFISCFATAAVAGEAVERVRSPVLFVADGTTLVVRLDGQARRLQLDGVEEVDSGPWDRRARRLEATRFLRSLVEDCEVAIEFSPGDRDAGRARVRRVGDGLRVDREVVARGFAVPTARDFEGKYELLRLATEARSARLGLWGDPPPTATTVASEDDRAERRRRAIQRRRSHSLACRQAAASADQQFWDAFSVMMASLPPPDV